MIPSPDYICLLEEHSLTKLIDTLWLSKFQIIMISMECLSWTRWQWIFVCCCNKFYCLFLAIFTKLCLSSQFHTLSYTLLSDLTFLFLFIFETYNFIMDRLSIISVMQILLQLNIWWDLLPKILMGSVNILLLAIQACYF